jgi:transposase InsO family protein
MYPLIAREAETLSVQIMCGLAALPRSGYYRYVHRQPIGETLEEMELRARIHDICLDFGFYGYRRVTAALHRRGYYVNHKRVFRLMRTDNLLCVRKRRWMICTTNSAHGYRVYPNLAAELTLTGPNQLWVADITYIRLRREFIYLAAILDAFSRRVIGWALSRTIDTQLTLSALRYALNTRTVPEGLVHHSDRGVQYAATEYVQLLGAHDIRISMNRKGNPYDNARAESFMKTLKHEEVLVNEYSTMTEAYHSIAHFLDVVYNQRRLHSALGYKPPVEFEADFYSQPSSTLTTICTVSV